MKQFLNNPYEEDISHSDDELNNIIEDDWEVLVADAQLQFQLGPALPLPARRLRVVVHNDSDDEVMGDGINIDLNAFYDNDLADSPVMDEDVIDEAASREGRVGLLPSSLSPEMVSDTTDSVGSTLHTDSPSDSDSPLDMDSPDDTEEADTFGPISLEPSSGELENDDGARRLYGDLPVDRETESTSVVEDIHTMSRDTV